MLLPMSSFDVPQAALRGFLPDDMKFLGNAANCYSVASDGCTGYGVNSCDNLQNSGCGCVWDDSLSECVNDSCSSINNNPNPNVAQDVCESSTRYCVWNTNSDKCQNGNGGGGTRTCRSNWNPSQCDNQVGCIYDYDYDFCDYAVCSDYDGNPSACEQWEDCYYKSNGKCKSVSALESSN